MAILLNLLKYAHKNCELFHLLIKTPVYEKADTSWYKKNIQLPIRKHLLELKLFPIQNGLVLMSQGLLPDFKENMKFLDFVRIFHPGRVICSDLQMYKFWLKLLSDPS